MRNSSIKKNIMKRLSFLAFVMVVLAAWVVPGYSVDVNWDAQYRVRAITTSNSQDFDKTNSADNDGWIDQRFRLGIKLTEAPVSGYVQLQIGGNGQNGSRTWGSSDTSTTFTSCTTSACTAGTTTKITNSGDTTSVIFRQAYLDFPVGPVGLRVGRTYASHGFLAGGIFENIADRYIVSYKVSDELSGSFIHAKAKEGSGGTVSLTTGNADQDRNIYNLGATWKPKGRPYDASARIYYVRDGGNADRPPLFGEPATTTTGTWDAWWFTGQTNMDFNPVKVYLSAAFLTGTSDPAAVGAANVDLSGFAFHGDVNVTQGPFKAGVVAGLGSGDDGSDPKKDKTFFAPGGASYIQTHIFFQAGENSYAPDILGLNLQTLNDITWAGLYGDFKATPDLTLSAKLATFKLTEAAPGDPKSIGKEIDLTANYMIYKNLSLLAFAAWFMPDDAFTGGVPPDDTVTEYYARLQWEW